ncbi:extracellular solute-binding protein [Mesorhizobium sp. B4-1-4]|uniref:extracellular solute-binding protein n=1 Tax=Mesorhizobium sp. B4-1-4 TaxID=2589888 RepID=UPI00112C01A5|nr:extracellular solute-binding protein [Mesorhizobium sp. B4-1-4]UCI31747.1 extracellular solute-binding protein [Mesorhizobium sp. B4-1-4]
MKITKLSTAALLAALSWSTSALAETSINVLYAFPSQFKELQEKLATEFHRQHPDINITFRPPAQTYDDGTAEVLRSSIVNDAPDVYFNGLNQLRVLVKQGNAVALDGFVDDKGEWDRLGYIPSMMSLGEVEGRSFGLPFSISTPIIYVNEDLLHKAGGTIENFPHDWKSIIELSGRMNDAEHHVTGLVYAHDASGNWLYQALVTSDGGSMGSADGCSVKFSDEHGKRALEQLQAFHDAGMPDMEWKLGRQAFAAGTVGIYVESSSVVTQMEKNIDGRFEMATMPFPITSKDGRLPAGGSVVMVLSKDRVRQKAAFEYAKFVTGPQGQTMMANMTGYAPGNQKALDDPKLLKDYYAKRPNLTTGISQLPLMTGWYNWSGQNSVKIVGVIQNYLNDVVSGRDTADKIMPAMARDVQQLLSSNCTPTSK